MKLFIVVLSVFVVIVITLNIIATRIVLNSEIDSIRQKITQLFFVWLIPIIGAIITREIHLRNYLKPKQPWGDSDSHWGVGAGDGIHFKD